MIEAILLNLFAQAVWDLALSPILGTSDISLDEIRDDPEAREARFGEAARLASEKLHGSGMDDERLSDFLSSSEVLVLIRSLYLFRLDVDSGDFKQARQEFTVLWERSFSGQSGASADEIFDVLLKATEDSLTAAIQDGVISAHEARSSARHQMLTQQIDAMERRIQLLIGSEAVDQGEVSQFEAELRREVHQRHAFITPPDFYGASQRVNIDRLYVTPQLSKVGRRGRDHDADPVTVAEWLSNLQQAVVLGDPGGGKSTLAAKLCHGIADDKNGWEVAGRRRAPVMVTLREYSALNKDRTLSVSNYIEDVASSRYQLNVPVGAVDYLLLSGRLMVIFDGLDELLETRHRQQIRDDVESFHRRFPAAPMLVTSRFVGYEQAPLNGDVFRTVTLAEFSDAQVSEYAHKWFGFDESLTSKECSQKADAFVSESRAVPDLRVNPLMLALMCNFYRGQNYLPRHLPDVYETCARMLFETWDRSRGIEQVLPIAEHIRPAMRYLAYWIYKDEALQGGATEGQLVDKAVEFLLAYRFDDEHEARHAAEAFIEFCAGRAWVFTDTGSAVDGEPLFQFTHRTFLEYFAADHIVATTDTTQALSDSLRPRIAAREWSVVAQVAYQLKSRATLAAPDQLLQDLVEHSQEGSLSERANLLQFAAECLTFLVPSPPVVRAVCRRVLGFVSESLSQEVPGEAATVIDSLIPTLARVGAEIRRTAIASTEEALVQRIETNEGDAVSAALVLSVIGGWAMPVIEVHDEWSEAAKQIKARTLERRKALANSHTELALAMATDGEVSIDELVTRHGTNALFVGRPVPLRQNAYFGPLTENLVYFVLRGEEGTQSGQWSKQLLEVGDVLLQSPPPWRYLGDGLRWGGPEFVSRVDDFAEDEVLPDALFGFVLIMAITAEEQLARPEDDEDRSVNRVRTQLEGTKSASLARVAPIIVGRLGNWEEGIARLDECSFSEEQRDLLMKWMKGEISFIES